MLIGLYFHVYSLPVEAKINMVQDGSITDHLVYKIFVVAIALSTTGYSIWGLGMVLRYKKKIKTYFSHIEKIDLSWLKTLLIGAIVVYGIINTIYIIDLFIPVASFGAMQFFSFAFGAVYIIFLGFFGLRQGNLFASQKINMNLEEAVEQHKKERNAGGKDEEFIHSLLKHMKEKKPYLNSDLNVSKLSRELDVTPEYLSKLINTKLNKNFFDFVNRYRVNEFKECCKNSSHQNFSLIGLAYDCGFNSKATFNRVFKNIAGITPSEYYKQVSEN
jgi:AraC-like DNA-binding protein